MLKHVKKMGWENVLRFKYIPKTDEKCKGMNPNTPSRFPLWLDRNPLCVLNFWDKVLRYKTYLI
jgi:hypothetical protein